jgi:acetyl-CoA acetyltransferase
MTHPMRAQAAIVGVADDVSPTGELDGELRAIEARVVRAALADAGLRAGDVDGLFTCTGGTMMPSVELAEYLGLHPTWTNSTQTGGSSYELHVEQAAAAIALGLCETAVVVYASTPRSNRRRGGSGMGVLATPERIEWEMPYGIALPLGAYALAAARHMAQYGTTPQQLAQIAVDTRAWATRNPRAFSREPITIDDVLASDMIASPLHRLECCPVTDGAGAVVVTSADRARDLAKPPALVLGAGSHHTHSMISQMPDLTTTPGRVSGARAFAMAGLSPADVDVVELYDSFTITVLLALEDLGFCQKGEGGPFVEGSPLGPGGALPGQTSGGGLSYTHPGGFGMFLLVEAVRQIRGEADDRQVPGVDVALAHGCGGVLSATSTVVLGSAATA